MKPRSVFLIFGVTALTMLALSGSIVLIFYLMIDVLNIVAMAVPIPVKILLFLSLLPIPFAAGALWAAGIAALMRRPARPLVKPGALTWGGSFLVVTIGLDLTQIPIFAVVGLLHRIPHIVHFLFTLVFLPGVAIMVFWNVNKLLGALALEQLALAVSLRSAAAAAAAFLVASLVLVYGPGWEVAGPLAGRDYSMISIMHICNTAAAFAGGIVLGWELRAFAQGAPAAAVLGSTPAAG